MNKLMKPGWVGAGATGTILIVYFAVLTLVSGFQFTLAQFRESWGYILALAIGFGTQMGLYWFLRSQVRDGSKTMVAASGTTSTLAMISCCTHYLANTLPILGTVGMVTLVSQYQTELFWVGIAFNAVGIAFIGSRIYKHKHHDMEP